MARIDYDVHTAAAFQDAREVPREGLRGWREAVRRHLNPGPGMTVVDIGAGTGAFATALCDWFGLEVVAVEPAPAMRARIPKRPDIHVLDGRADALPLPDATADAAWLSTVIHHIPDLKAAAHEIRRILRPAGSVLIRGVFAGRGDRITIVRCFPEAARTIDTYPSVEQACRAFADAGFAPTALEPVPQTDPTGLPGLLDRLDALRTADTLMRGLTEQEFTRGRERLRRAASVSTNPTTSWLDLLVLRQGHRATRPRR
jgi:ubiquinone/menaquinone biosynthesis C-methylase UbiE